MIDLHLAIIVTTLVSLDAGRLEHAIIVLKLFCICLFWQNYDWLFVLRWKKKNLMSKVSLTSRKFQPKHFFSFNFVLSYCKYILSFKINNVIQYGVCFNLSAR